MHYNFLKNQLCQFKIDDYKTNKKMMFKQN